MLSTLCDNTAHDGLFCRQSRHKRPCSSNSPSAIIDHFGTRHTLSLAATNLKSGLDDAGQGIHEVRLTPSGVPVRVLTSAAIYGPNGSGKSNLISALKFMRTFVLLSSGVSQADEEIPVEPFRLDEVSETHPSFFEVVFLMDGRRYRYGFEATSKQVTSEWLFGFNKQEIAFFTRDEKAIRVNLRNFTEGASRKDFTRPDALFLSVVANLNGMVAAEIVKWFRQLVVGSGLSDHDYRHVSEKWLKSDHERPILTRFVRQLDLGIGALSLHEPWGPDDVAPRLRTSVGFSTVLSFSWSGEPLEAIFRTAHPTFDHEGNRTGSVEFDLDDQESDGTRKLIYLAGIMLTALETGGTLVFDELDARLHPAMTREIVRVFNSPDANPHGSQLIFATHNSNLLSDNLLRRDQIWFTGKDERQGSELVALAEYKMEDGNIARHDAPLEERYLQGRFGAIPHVGNLVAVVADIVAGTFELSTAGESGSENG